MSPDDILQIWNSRNINVRQCSRIHFRQILGMAKISRSTKNGKPPYFPMANGSAERAVQVIKKAIRCWKLSQTHQPFKVYLEKVLFHHRISTNARGKSPAEIVFGRQLKAPIVSNFSQGEKIIYKQTPEKDAEEVIFLMPKGNNTSWIIRHGNNALTLSSDNQIAEDKSTRNLLSETTSNENEIGKQERTRRPANRLGECI